MPDHEPARAGAAAQVTVGTATQVQGTGDAAAVPGGTVPLAVDTSVGLEAVNHAGYRIQHQDFGAYLRQAGAGSDAVTKNGTSWVVRTGLASADGVSFESVDWPGYYLAAPAGGAGATGLVKNDGSAAFAARATFAAVTGATGQNTSFQVWGDKTLYLRHEDFQLTAQKLDGTDLGRADSTFAVRAGYSAAGAVPLSAGRSVGLEAVNYAGYRVQHENYLTYLRQAGAGSAATVKNDSSWVVRAGLASADGVSFESVSYPGWFLTAPAGGAGAVGLVKNDGSAAFAARATYAPVAGNTGQGTSLQVWGDRTLHLRHQGFQLFAQKLDGTDLGKADTTSTVRSGLAPAPVK